MGPVTWEARQGRAVWAGRALSDWANDLVFGLVAAFDPLEVWLYGSVARGDDDVDSDIDLLLVLDCYDPATAVDLKQQASRSSTAPVPFDVAFTDMGRMRRRRRIAGTLERAAVNEGRRIYQRD